MIRLKDDHNASGTSITYSSSPDGLVINDQCAYTKYGVIMGDGFSDALHAPAPLKQFVESKSRLEDGKRVHVPTSSNGPKLDSRDMTLTFVIVNMSLKNKFLNALYAGAIKIGIVTYDDARNISGIAWNYSVPDTYNLVYLGQSATYSQDMTGKTSKIVVKFEEPKPSRPPQS